MSRLIVSFTSYPPRIDAVKTVLDSLYSQTMKADEIILWLAEEEFPNKEADLPIALQEDLDAKRFTLRWCDNLGSHKKYFYAMQEYPEDIIVTVDDGTIYSQDTLRILMDVHRRFPHAVVATIVSLATLHANLEPRMIREWLVDFQQVFEPSMLLMGVGVGGVLYPPHSVSEKIFDKEIILDACTVNERICGDDLLLKAGEMLSGTPVVFAECELYRTVPYTQDVALFKMMPHESHNDLIIERIKERLQNFFDESSAQRLKVAVSNFEETDNKFGLQRRHWIERPSRDLKKRLGYLSLLDASAKPDASDYERVRDIAWLASRVYTAYSHGPADDEAAEALGIFRQDLMAVPGIEGVREADIVTRGLIDYGALLYTECPVLYHEIPVYLLFLKNWQTFMADHPDCDPIFREEYKKFLKNTESRMKKAEGVLSEAEIDEWRLAYEEAKREIEKAPVEDKPSKSIKGIIKKFFKI